MPSSNCTSFRPQQSPPWPPFTKTASKQPSQILEEDDSNVEYVEMDDYTNMTLQAEGTLAHEFETLLPIPDHKSQASTTETDNQSYALAESKLTQCSQRQTYMDMNPAKSTIRTSKTELTHPPRPPRKPYINVDNHFSATTKHPETESKHPPQPPRKPYINVDDPVNSTTKPQETESATTRCPPRQSYINVDDPGKTTIKTVETESTHPSQPPRKPYINVDNPVNSTTKPLETESNLPPRPSRKSYINVDVPLSSTPKRPEPESATIPCPPRQSTTNMDDPGNTTITNLETESNLPPRPPRISYINVDVPLSSTPKRPEPEMIPPQLPPRNPLSKLDAGDISTKQTQEVITIGTSETNSIPPRLPPRNPTSTCDGSGISTNRTQETESIPPPLPPRQSYLVLDDRGRSNSRTGDDGFGLPSLTRKSTPPTVEKESSPPQLPRRHSLSILNDRRVSNGQNRATGMLTKVVGELKEICQTAGGTGETTRGSFKPSHILKSSTQVALASIVEELPTHVQMIENTIVNPTASLWSPNNIHEEHVSIWSRNNHQFDFYIFYDAYQDSQLQRDLVDKLTLELENRGFIGQHRQRDCPPGSDKDQYHRNACIESDIVICLLGKKHMEETNGLHIDNLASAKKIKTDRAAQDHIVVLLYDHDQLIIRANSILAFLELSEIVSTKADDWIIKIIQVFEQLPKENELKRLYFTLLPEWCAPLLRGPLPLEKSWLDVFLTPEIIVKSIVKGTVEKNEEIEHISEVIDIFKHTNHGGRVIIIADGGMGKSTIVSHMTRSWIKNDTTMKKYGFVFLTPQRLVNNHTENLDRIICCDLKLLNKNCMAKLRNMLRTNSHKCLFLIDGFDELDSASVRNKSTFIQLLEKESKIGRKSTVVVTTRPHCADLVLQVIGDTYLDVRVEGLSEDTVIDRAHDILTETKTNLKQPSIGTITDYMPLELLRMPLLFNIATYVWKCQITDLHDKATIRKFSGMTDIFDAILGIMIGIKEEKKKETEKVIFYTSMKDSVISSSTWYLLRSLAAMSYECLGRGELIISTETLEKYRLDSTTCGEIGFLHISSGSKPQGNFVHNYFMEYCAGFHIAYEKSSMRQIVKKINQDQTTLTKALGLYSNAMLFAVGIKPEILNELSSCKFCIPLVRMPGSPHSDVDLSLEAQLLQESTSEEARRNFCETIVRNDLSVSELNTTSHSLNSMGYVWMQKELGVERCLEFLKRIHQNDVTEGDLVLKGHKGHRYITDTLLLSQLPYVRFAGVRTLHVCHAKMTLNISESSAALVNEADGIDNVHLDEIDWTMDDLIKFLSHIPALGKVKVLLLGPRCRLKPISLKESNLKKVNVKKIVVSSPISLDQLEELMRICKILVIEENARLKKKSLQTWSSASQTKAVSELFLPSSWDYSNILDILTVTSNCNHLQCLEIYKTSIDGCNVAGEIPDKLIEALTALRTLEQLRITGCPPLPSIDVDTPTRNAVRFKGQASPSLTVNLTLAWRKKKLILEDTTIATASITNIRDFSGCVEELTLGRGVHCEVDTLGFILPLLSQPEGMKILTIDTGCVLHTQYGAAATQGIDCPVEQLFVFNTITLTSLHRLLSLLGDVDKLYLGGATWTDEIKWRRRKPSGCQVDCDTNESVSLPGVKELVMFNIRGARSMFQRITLPDVKRIEVNGWATNTNGKDTVEDIILHKACPQAEVEYPYGINPADH